MSSSIQSSHFSRHGCCIATSLGVSLSRAADTPAASEKIVVAILGTGGRGTEVAQVYARQPGVELAYVCDVDSKHVAEAAKAIEKLGKPTPKTAIDFRKVLDDKAVDAVYIATPNHWHAPMAMLACQAGKHVYVEKPCSHDPWEGEMLVQNARKHKRLVQMGNQRRSMPKIIEAMQRLHEGVIGRTYLAQSYYTNERKATGVGKPADPPKELDYALWQGPAPAKPFHTNYLHYTWHWFWHWGNGELGNNGIHYLDVCRWGLGVDFPIHVASTGGRYRYEDDQQTPDTNQVSFEFEGRKSATWEGLSCNKMPEGQKADVIFYGDNGSLRINGSNYSIYDPKGKEIEKVAGEGKEELHIANFLNAIRGKCALNSEIEQGAKSTLLCHLGNISYRTGRALKCSPKDGTILEDKEAMTFCAGSTRKAGNRRFKRLKKLKNYPLKIEN